VRREAWRGVRYQIWRDGLAGRGLRDAFAGLLRSAVVAALLQVVAAFLTSAQVVLTSDRARRPCRTASALCRVRPGAVPSRRGAHHDGGRGLVAEPAPAAR
jgi:ABC-type Fe3+ transport system permease subunit